MKPWNAETIYSRKISERNRSIRNESQREIEIKLQMQWQQSGEEIVAWGVYQVTMRGSFRPLEISIYLL